MGYRVTTGYVTVETAVGDGRAHVDVPRGRLLPPDVPVEQVERLLAAGDIEPDGAPTTRAEPAPADPPGDSTDDVPVGTVDEVLDWVGEDPDRAGRALAAEQAKGSGSRSTLVTKLTALADQ